MTTYVEVKQTVFDENEVRSIHILKENAQHTMHERKLNNTFTDSIVLAGGCFASWFHGEVPKDHDVYIIGDLARQTEIKKYIDAVSVGIVDDVTATYVRPNNKILGVHNDKVRTVQYIYTGYETREELIRDFDYVHCMVSYHNGKIHLTKSTYDAIKYKLLVKNPNGLPVEQWRRDKFLARGWKEKSGVISNDTWTATQPFVHR